jgi:ABC-2 type transport system permease protein
MLLAYGLVAHSPWYYFVMLVPFLVAFSVIPVGFGAIVCLVVVRHLPSRRGLMAASLFAGGVALILWGGWPLITGFQRDLLTPDWFLSVLDRLRFTEHRWLPSWWLSSGLLDAAEGEGAESVLFLALLISNALFFQQLAMWISGALLRSAYSALQGRSSGRRRARVAWLDRVAMGLTAPLPAPTRLLIIKDVRLFRRDPMQWSQILIFFGLLGLYLLNVRRFSYDSSYAGWVNMLSFLNVAVVGLLLSTFTTRFIFPMISLEGSRFWILGLLPLRRETILWSKFLFSAGGATIPCAGLILLSDLLFGVGPLIVSVHQVACLLLCLGLSGIAVGLGAKLPSLREQSPSRIAAGFGGTVNLIVSTVYIVLVVVLMVLPYHLYVGDYANRDFGLHSYRHFLGRWLDLWLVGGTASSVLLSLVATVAPLRVGFRAIRELEF